MTRRVGVLRVGLPTLLACAIAVAPGAAVAAEHAVPAQASAFVNVAARAAADVFDPPPRGDGRDGRDGDSR